MEGKDGDFKVIISLKKCFTKIKIKIKKRERERNVFIIYSPLNLYDLLFLCRKEEDI